MALEQMICFVTPQAPDQVPQSVTRRIDAMCTKIGRVHFATLALLPPAPGACALAPPSLMLEIVVDEDLAPADLIERMLDTGFATLWQLCKPNWNGPRHADPGTKRAWLRAFLTEHAYPADGGFVGARDRSVAQVRAEDRLFMKARSALHALPKAQRPGTARELAERMANWARAHGFGWIADPAPRSRWRKGPDFGLLDWAALFARMRVPVLALLGFLFATGWATLWAGDFLNAMQWPPVRAVSAALVLASLTVFLALLPLLLAMFTGGGILVFGVQLFIYSVVALWILGSGIYDALGPGDLAWPTCRASVALLGFASLLVFAAAAAFAAMVPVLFKLRAPPWFPALAVLVAMAVVAAACLCLTQLMFGALESARACSPREWLPLRTAEFDARLAWGLGALLLVLAALAFAFLFATRWAPWLLRLASNLDRPDPLPPLPAHQVHPGIQACEAALTGRTSHMISLTEIRRPYFFHRTLLRGYLWLVSKLGEYVFTEGILGGARGIKFGHWHIVGGGKRLLFCSNFDSAFGGYLDEFILGASEGINLIWGNSELRPRGAARWDQPGVDLARAFPPTRWLIYKGCKAEQNFKAYVRASMLPHLHRFEAYCLANEDIERATRLREALRGTRSALKDDQVARALES